MIVEGPYAVQLVTGRPSSAVASGTRDALDRVNVDVQGRTLRIRRNRSAWGGAPGADTGPVTIALATRSLRSVRLIGPAQAQIEGARGLNVEFSVEGSGSLRAAGVDAETLAWPTPAAQPPRSPAPCRHRATDGRGCVPTRCPGRNERCCQRCCQRGDADAVRGEQRVLFPEGEVPLKLIRCDADHDMGNAIQRQRFPDDVRIGGQPVLPESYPTITTGAAVTSRPSSRRIPVPAPAPRRSP